jgi:hypothetical protein
MDEPIRDSGEHGDEPLTLHDCLAAPVDDPATTAACRVDWASVVKSLDRTAKAILTALIEGRKLTPLVARLKRNRTSLHYDKVKLGRLIQERLGHDILQQVQARPGWTSTVRFGNGWPAGLNGGRHRQRTWKGTLSPFP